MHTIAGTPCRATRVAADFLDFIAFCRCSTGVALHPLKILVSHLPPPCAGRCRTEIWVGKGVALHGGVAATVAGVALHCATKVLGGNDQNRVEKQNVVLTWLRPVTWSSGHLGRRFMCLLLFCLVSWLIRECSGDP